MCGITGAIALAGGAAPTPEMLKAMCDALYHRGPDDEGREIRDGVALGMRRLAIIDLAGGHQPLYNEDRSVRVVFNGEIYNFRELRAALQAKGHRFASASDGEVLPHLWEEYGADFAKHLNGMFAIALHDTRQQKLVLVRDHIGIKPLYYHRSERHLVFGSEIKSLLASGLVSRSLNVDALGQFLAWEYVPAPHTLFAGIAKLEPGAMLSIELGSGRTRHTTWWDVPVPDPNGSAPDAGSWDEAVEATLRQAVQRQLVSDVPLGAFLSGGVDSSLVVASMGAARAFSIGFQDQSYNEVQWAERVAQHLGVDHRVEIIEQKAVDLFDHLMTFMDDPIGDFSIFPTYMVSRMARRDVTVALSGDGGDELFGGYDTYVAQAMARTWDRFPASFWRGIVNPILQLVPPSEMKKGLVNKVKRFAEGLALDQALGHARWRVFADGAVRQKLFTAEARDQLTTPVEHHITALFERAGSRTELERGLYVDLNSYLTDNCLLKVDRMSMACSLETRVPFLDPDLITLAFAVPSAQKLQGSAAKIILKRIAARQVPRDCVYRPKEGFSIPIKNWLKTDFRPLLEDLLAPRRLAAEGIFQVKTVEALKAEHLAGRANHSHVLWSMLVFQDWRQRWSA